MAASARAAALLVGAATLTVSTTTFAQPPGPAGETFKVVTVAEGLRNPWSMAWLPNGDMLVTERVRRAAHHPRRQAAARARRRACRPCAHKAKAVCRKSPCIRTSRKTASSILSYAKPRNDDKEGHDGAVRAPSSRTTASSTRRRSSKRRRGTTAPGHFGARIAFDGQGHLFMSVGDSMAGLFPRPRAARWTRISKATRRRGSTNHQGKILRLNDDGTRAARQSVRRPRRRAARDLELGPPQPAGPRASIRETGDALGDGARPARRRRAQRRSRRARTTAGP